MAMEGHFDSHPEGAPLILFGLPDQEAAKVLAMEGHFESYPEGAPFILFGMPNDEDGRVDFPIEIPGLTSLLLEHDLRAPIEGLNRIPPDERPPVAIVFWSFRVMVGLGMLMLALGVLSLWMRWRGRLFSSRLLHRFALVMGPAGFVAVIAGWITTEVGRQPYVIYGLMRTEDAVSPIAAPAVSGSLLAFVLVYFAVFGAGTWYILKLMAQPPHVGEEEPLDAPIRTAGITPAAAVRPDEPTSPEPNSGEVR
jgi:cytochrome d ubiquinol oxidase subunit I